MMTTKSPDLLDWRQGQNGAAVPVSRRFDDPYYSLENGLAEARHVFLQGNDLPARLRPGFHVAELGFGTGLNFLALLHSWRTSGGSGQIRYTTFELHPLTSLDMQRALSAFPEISRLAADIAMHFGEVRFETAEVAFEMIVGDARKTLPRWPGRADAWFLDGFAPARNPELWELPLLQSVAQHSTHGATAATYTAAGHVRRALDSAGFEVSRVPGYGRKRHMTRARLRS